MSEDRAVEVVEEGPGPGRLTGVRLVSGLKSLGRRVRGTLSLSLVTAAGAALVGGALEVPIAISSGVGLPIAALVNELLEFAALGFMVGLLAAFGIFLAARGRESGIARSFVFGTLATGILYLSAILFTAGPGVQIAWTSTLSTAGALSVMVGIASAVLVRISRGAPGEEDGEPQAEGSGF